MYNVPTKKYLPTDKVLNIKVWNGKQTYTCIFKGGLNQTPKFSIAAQSVVRTVL